MLTPGPALARRPRFTRPGWKGMGFRGLGQTAYCDANPNDPGCDPSYTTGVNYDTTTFPTTNTPRSQSGNIDWTQIAVAGITAAQKGVQSAQQNPLLHLQPNMTYQSTPQGGVFVSTAGAVPGGSTTGLTTATLGNLLPIILIGGVFMMFMMGRR